LGNHVIAEIRDSGRRKEKIMTRSVRSLNRCVCCLLFLAFAGIVSSALGETQYDAGSAPSVGAEILSTTSLVAYNGAASSRKTIGIGESVALSLDMNAFLDSDRYRYRENSCMQWGPWQTLYDTLGGCEYQRVSGMGGVEVGYLGTDGIFTATFISVKSAITQSTVIRVRAGDAGWPADDSTDAVKTITFSVVIPSLSFVSAVIAPAWAAFTLGPPNNYIGGGADRTYELTPRGVNFSNLSFREDIPATTWTWNDGSQGIWPGAFGTFPFDAQGRTVDRHSTGGYPISKIAGQAQSLVSWPGTFGWFLQSGNYYGGINWIHDFMVTSGGVATLYGNGNAGNYGPWR
jgi:hypothetical protein